jgi:hypothetical protein
MNTRNEPHAQSLWHVSAWPGFIAHIAHRPAKDASGQTPVRMTRRQKLLAAQELKRQEQRAHLLEQLSYIKPRGRGTS